MPPRIAMVACASGGDYQFDEATGKWLRLVGADDFRLSKERRDILRTMQDFGDASPAELASVLGKTPKNCLVPAQQATQGRRYHEIAQRTLQVRLAVSSASSSVELAPPLLHPPRRARR